MAETIFNLFLFVSGELITSIGIEPYKIVDDASDQQMKTFLRERSQLDHSRAYAAKLLTPLSLESYRSKERLGTNLALFEELFEMVNAPQEPLFCITHIVDGVPKFEGFYEGAIELSKLNTGETMPDYLFKYMTPNGFDMARLLDDDYMQAIKLLFNSGRYVSTTKLILSFIDTLAFIEYGDVKDNFQQWLNYYVDLNPLNVTASEIWELRNGLLHTSTLDSRKVREKKIKRLVPCVNYRHGQPHGMSSDQKPLEIITLVKALQLGLEKWIATLNHDPTKMEKFVERYDLVVSDSRVVWLHQD